MRVGAEELYFCVFVFFLFFSIILFSSPVCSTLSRVHDVKVSLGRGGRGSGALDVYVKAQRCLMLHKAFVHSVSKLCVCVSWEGRLTGRARGCMCM